MRVAHGLAAELPVDEHQMHAGVERARTQQGVGGHEVVEPVALHAAQAVRGERRLELEDAGGAARPEQPVGLRVVEREPLHVERDAVALGHHPHRVMDDRQGPQAENVDLQHADLLECDHVILRDDGVGLLRREADRDVVGERTRGDHHSCGVHGRVAGQPLDP